MGFINLGRLNIRKRNSCASALVSLSDVQPPSVYKSHILNGPSNKLYLKWVIMIRKRRYTIRLAARSRISGSLTAEDCWLVVLDLTAL